MNRQHSRTSSAVTVGALAKSSAARRVQRPFFVAAVIVVGVLLAAPVLRAADVITLKNGDRLTGDIDKIVRWIFPP